MLSCGIAGPPWPSLTIMTRLYNRSRLRLLAATISVRRPQLLPLGVAAIRRDERMQPPREQRGRSAATRPSTVTVGFAAERELQRLDFERDDPLTVGIGEQRLVSVGDQANRQRRRRGGQRAGRTGRVGHGDGGRQAAPSRTALPKRFQEAGFPTPSTAYPNRNAAFLRRFCQWAVRGSNTRPPACKAGARPNLHVKPKRVYQPTSVPARDGSRPPSKPRFAPLGWL